MVPIFNFPFQQQFSNKRMKLTDLNEDCLFLIFDQYSVPDLINVAKINSKFAFVAAHIFRRKYSHYKLHIEKTKYFSNEIPFEDVK